MPLCPPVTGAKAQPSVQQQVLGTSVARLPHIIIRGNTLSRGGSGMAEGQEKSPARSGSTNDSFS